jgi:hypothetical protein
MKLHMADFHWQEQPASSGLARCDEPPRFLAFITGLFLKADTTVEGSESWCWAELCLDSSMVEKASANLTAFFKGGLH